MMSTPVLVFLRIFGLPMAFVALYLFAFGKPGGHAEAAERLVAPYVAGLVEQLGGLGSGRFSAPVAVAKFTSGRTLSGGGFIRP
jgi:hypothetical protein